MGNSFAKQTYIATKGNLAVKAAGLPVFTAGSKKPNVMSGELVVFNPDTNLTVAAASIPTETKVVVAVGVGPDNQIADTLRYFGDGINLCEDKVEALVTTPVCGTPQVVDVFFDGTKCRKGYGFNVLLDDYMVRSNNPQNDYAMYPFAVINPCGTNCDCNDTESCDKLVCAFVDAVNGKVNDDARSISIFQNKKTGNQYQPFRAARLWNSSASIKKFVLTPDNTECSGCTSVPAITGISIDGDETEFTATTATVDATVVTLVGQLERVIQLINEALAPTGGYAHLSRSINGCCGYTIEITTCADVIEFLSGEDANIEATTETNPFTTFTTADVCAGCDSGDTVASPTCGMRFYIDPLTVDCLCDFPPNITPPMNYFRTIKVTPTGDWGCGEFYTREASAQVLDEGFGYYYKDREHFQDNGGIGRGYRMSNTHRGEIGLPDQYSRSTNATTIKCKDAYCVYNMLWTRRHDDRFANAVRRTTTENVTVLVPSGDSTTKTSWETFLAQLHTVGTCVTQDITC